MMMASVISTLVLLLTGCLIPAVVGIYVYRDARRRQLNALLWTVVAVLVPGLIGFLIYLLVRGTDTDLRCPNCKTPVRRDFALCPYCGTRLRPSCPSCGAPVEAGWQVCPFCAQPLPKQSDAKAPVHAGDRSVGKLLTVGILVPLALVGLFLLGTMVFSGGGACGVSELTRDQYFREQTSEEASTYVAQWLEELDRTGQAGALQYRQPQGEQTHYDLLVFVPGTGEGDTGVGMTGSLFGTTLRLDLTDTGSSDTLYLLTTALDGKRLKLKVTVEGESVPCAVTEVDFPPAVLYGDSEPPLPEELTISKLEGEELLFADTVQPGDRDSWEKLTHLLEDAKELPPEDPAYDRLDQDHGTVYHILQVYGAQERRQEALVWQWNGACYVEAGQDPVLYQAEEELYELLVRLDRDGEEDLP